MAIQCRQEKLKKRQTNQPKNPNRTPKTKSAFANAGKSELLKQL